MLNWAQAFSTFCFLDNHRYPTGPHAVECLLAAGVKRQLSVPAGQALQSLQSFLGEKKSWLFGHLGYDLKNETEALSSGHPDQIQFPDLFFFEPEILVRLTAGQLIIEARDPEAVYRAILEQPEQQAGNTTGPLTVQSRFNRETYLSVIRELQQRILRGDCYEINFCQEFFAEGAVIDPLQVYKKLSAESPNPFSGFYRVEDKWLICASPERFIKRTGNKIISQPIKGTAPRIRHDEKADQENKQGLYQSAKERAENVMVVDLVRNDLSRVCREGSVQVDELYGIYTFPQVYQMISTVSGELEDGTSFADIIRAVFPMGSMTGAPKKSVMQLIEQYERTRRGIFSGALGYISPEGDFDFNVVIRSILYNATNQYVSVGAGSAITHYSQAESEWEECQLKVAAIKKVLGAIE
ncbi:MAG: anthranilate synthase component I family protein [Sphingobacteriales bacterium]|nr:anthranilate synthase component I family protein [Sphingobacteriales bacterium]